MPARPPAKQPPPEDEAVAALRAIDERLAPPPANRFGRRIEQKSAGVPALLDELASTDPERQLDAIEALEQIGDPAAVPALRLLVEDPAPAVRAEAAVALLRLGDATLQAAVRASLQSGERSKLIGAAIVLGRSGDRSAVGDLIEALEYDDDEVVSAVAWALGRIGDERAVLPLTNTLGAGSAPANVCEALGRIGSPRAMRVLLQALRSPHADVRAHAARALGRLKHEAGSQTREVIRPALRPLLEDGSRLVRVCAAVALYALNDPLARAALARELGQGSP